MILPTDIINRLKVTYYEVWNPEDYGYMCYDLANDRIYFTNDLDCDGKMYFCFKSFPKTIKKLENKE